MGDAAISLLSPLDRHLALHGLALRKAAVAEDIGELVGLSRATVDAVLAWAEAGGRIALAGGKYMLTVPAQVALRAEYSRFYQTQRASAAMRAACDQFELINTDLKRLITDWQTIEVGGERVVNDHANKDYDRQVIDRLGALHERFEPVLARMATSLPRLSIYGRLLLAALEKAEDGANEWVSDVRLPSYHTVWFEMHEDLLRVMGRLREE